MTSDKKDLIPSEGYLDELVPKKEGNYLAKTAVMTDDDTGKTYVVPYSHDEYDLKWAASDGMALMPVTPPEEYTCLPATIDNKNAIWASHGRYMAQAKHILEKSGLSAELPDDSFPSPWNFSSVDEANLAVTEEFPSYEDAFEDGWKPLKYPDFISIIKEEDLDACWSNDHYLIINDAKTEVSLYDLRKTYDGLKKLSLKDPDKFMAKLIKEKLGVE